MNIIVSIGRNTPHGVMTDALWNRYVYMVREVVEMFGFDHRCDLITRGNSEFRHNGAWLTEESVTWAFVLDGNFQSLSESLTETRKAYSCGQDSIAFTGGATAFI